MSLIPFPSVRQPHTGNAVLVVNVTSKQVDYIAIDDASMQYTVHKARIMEFAQQHQPTDYPPSKFAAKVLSSNNIPASAEAETHARRIVMENSNIIVVSPSAEFIGRFADAETAIAASPAEARVIAIPIDLEVFKKAQLLEQLAVKPDGDVTKAQLAELLYAQYMQQDVALPKAKGRKAKAAKEPKEPKERAATVKSVVRASLQAAPQSIAQLIAAVIAAGIADFPTEPDAQAAKVQTPVNNLRAELELVSFVDGDVRYYVPRANATEAQLAKPAPKVKLTEEQKQEAKAAKEAERAAAKEAKAAEKAAAKEAAAAAKAAAKAAENTEQAAA